VRQKKWIAIQKKIKKDTNKMSKKIKRKDETV